MKPNQPEEKFSEDPQEQLHIENQILKLKMQAESGAYFGPMADDLPPEIENDFLKHVQAFEDAWQNVKQVAVHEILGNPEYKEAALISDDEIPKELERLHALMEERNMQLDVLGDYDPRVIYTFITEELFKHETNDMQLPGWTTNFIYEEFHPNHKMDIENRAKEFLTDWFNRRFNEYSLELNDTFILPDASTLSREEVIAKFNTIFASFVDFNDTGYKVSEISFKWDEAQGQGLGHAEGTVWYDAEMENGELVHIEGPFKLYMCNEQGWWNIFYMVFPGVEL